MSRLSTALVSGLLCILAACGHESGSGTGATPPPPPERRATCLPAGLESAHTVATLVMPTGCSFQGGGSPAAPLIVTNAAELEAHLLCTGVAPPAIDLTANDLVLVTHMLSPAYGGGETRDDGTTVTLVTRSRPNCPDDPLPMPMNSTFGFLLPKGATRVFHEAYCTLPRQC